MSTLATTHSNVSIHLNIWFGLFIWLTGNINCFANMLVFRSRSFRSRACFIYLFWESFTNFFFHFILVTRVLQGGFQIPIMPRYDVTCKIREFLSEYIFQMANTFFVCATLDRLLPTQRSMGEYESVIDTVLRRPLSFSGHLWFRMQFLVGSINISIKI